MIEHVKRKTVEKELAKLMNSNANSNEFVKKVILNFNYYYYFFFYQFYTIIIKYYKRNIYN